MTAALSWRLSQLFVYLYLYMLNGYEYLSRTSTHVNAGWHSAWPQSLCAQAIEAQFEPRGNANFVSYNAYSIRKP